MVNNFYFPSGLLWFNGTSTIVGYLIPNRIFRYILNTWFVNTFCRYILKWIWRRGRGRKWRRRRVGGIKDNDDRIRKRRKTIRKVEKGVVRGEERTLDYNDVKESSGRRNQRQRLWRRWRGRVGGAWRFSGGGGGILNNNGVKEEEEEERVPREGMEMEEN